MHPSVLDFIRNHLSSVEVRGKRVLEVGSQDINGTPRSVICPLEPEEYIGVDSESGPCVDMVVNADSLVAAFGAESFDLVVSNSSNTSSIGVPL